MTVQTRIETLGLPDSGEVMVEDASEVVETGFPIGARIKFQRVQKEDKEEVHYVFSAA